MCCVLPKLPQSTELCDVGFSHQVAHKVAQKGVAATTHLLSKHAWPDIAEASLLCNAP